MPGLANVQDALAFVRRHGVVLASAKGPVPRLTEAIVAEPIRGSWWAHPQSYRIYAILAGVAESEQILACRLINRKITFVDCALWAPLVRLASLFDPAQLAKIVERHTPSGRHVSDVTAFPDWVSPEVLEQARRIPQQQALDALASWIPRADGAHARRTP